MLFEIVLRPAHPPTNTPPSSPPPLFLVLTMTKICMYKYQIKEREKKGGGGENTTQKSRFRVMAGKKPPAGTRFQPTVRWGKIGTPFLPHTARPPLAPPPPTTQDSCAPQKKNTTIACVLCCRILAWWVLNHPTLAVRPSTSSNGHCAFLLDNPQRCAVISNKQQQPTPPT